MERQCDHRLDGAQVNINHAVVICDVCRIQFLVCVRSAMHGEELLGVLIGAPDGGKTCGLGGHNVHAVSVIGVHRRNARADELHDLVLDISVFKYCADDCQRNILRADTRLRLAVQINGNNTRICDVIGIAQQLLYQLAAALADCHRAQCAIAGMGVRAENHAAAACHGLTHILVNDCHVRRNIDAAVLLCSGQSEYMVILIDGAADSTQGVVTVGQHVRNREALHTGSLRRLHNADKGDVMGCHGIELDAQLIHVIGYVVCRKNGIRDGTLLGFCLVCCLTGQFLHFGCIFFFDNLVAADQIYAAVI